MEKKEIIANLYTIKAGLSAISLEKEKIDKKQKIIDITNAELGKNIDDQHQAEADIGLYQQKAGESQEALNSARQEYNNLQHRLKKEDREINTRYKSEKRKGFFVTVVLPALFLAFIIFSAIVLNKIAKMEGEDLMSTSESRMIFAGAAVPVLFIVYHFVKVAKIGGRQKVEKERRKKEARQYQNAHTQRTSAIQAEINKNTSMVESTRDKLAKLRLREPEIDQEIVAAKQAYNETAAACVPVAQGVYNALLAQYHDFLDEREWEIIDLLIYYFETGRADTLKEALIHADQQRALDKIAAAVDFANESLCQTIDRNIANMSAYLGSRIEQLSIEVRAQTYQMVESNRQMTEDISRANQVLANRLESSISSLNSAISSAAAQSAAQSATQTAMLSKMRSDSRSLAKDVRFMMESDHHYYR